MVENTELQQKISEFITLMEPKIKKSLYNTTFQDREDLAQEVKIKIIEYLSKQMTEETIGFWEFKSKFD